MFSRLWLPRMFICFGIKLIFTIINQTNSSVTLWNLSCCKVYLQSRRTLSISVPSGHWCCVVLGPFKFHSSIWLGCIPGIDTFLFKWALRGCRYPDVNCVHHDGAFTIVRLRPLQWASFSINSDVCYWRSMRWSCGDNRNKKHKTLFSEEGAKNRVMGMCPRVVT